MILAALARAALWLWFLGCVTTWRFGRLLLVEGTGVKSAEFAMLCLYSLGLALAYACPGVGRWALAAVLALWLAVQFMCHWYFTIFGASREKLKGYNECFRGTARLFPMREDRLVPDLYHIVLHLLILLNLVVCLAGG